MVDYTCLENRDWGLGKKYFHSFIVNCVHGVRVEKCKKHSCGQRDASLLGKGKIPNLSPFPLPLFPTSARSLLLTVGFDSKPSFFEVFYDLYFNIYGFCDDWQLTIDY